MTTPNIVPTGYQGDDTDYLKAPVDRSGAVRDVQGTVSVASGTAADAFVGLVPFNKGARLKIDDKSIHCGNFGAGATTVNVGVIYDDESTYTNDVDAWVSASTAPQSGGFVTVDEIEGLTFVSEANGWLAVQLKTAAADAAADITFQVQVAYDG